MSVKALQSCLLLALIYVASIASVLSHECPKWGYIDKSGKMVIQPFAGGQGHFINGLAQVSTCDGSYAQYMDKSGKIVISPMWDGVQAYAGFPFSERLAAVNFVLSDGRHCGGYIDDSGKFVIKPVFQYATPFSEGFAVVVAQNGTSGYIDKTGQWLIGPQFAVAYPFRSGLATTKNFSFEIACGSKGSRFSSTPEIRYFDKAGKEVSQIQAQKIGRIDSNSLAFLKSVVDREATIDDKSFDEVRPFCDGMAAVKKNGLWGFIDSTGKLVIEPQFYRVEDFSDGLAAVHFAESNHSREPIKNP